MIMCIESITLLLFDLYLHLLTNSVTQVTHQLSFNDVHRTILLVEIVSAANP